MGIHDPMKEAGDGAIAGADYHEPATDDEASATHNDTGRGGGAVAGSYRARARVFQLLQRSPARLCRSVASGRLVRRSWAAMHRSDSAIFRFSLATACRCAWPSEPAIWPILNRAISIALKASRFFRS